MVSPDQAARSAMSPLSERSESYGSIAVELMYLDGVESIVLE